jgi:DNA-directed RNA polymerase specialized sigma24 family protein
MARADRLPLWWDRETDGETDRLLREDVRTAAHRVWRWVCVKSREILGDSSDAPEVMEAAVTAICRYLDKKNIAVNSTDLSGLVAVAAYRLLRRAAKKRGRVELVGSTTGLAEKLRAPDWRHETDRQILIEELAREMDERTRGILRLRMAGYGWDEIGRMLHMTATAVRTAFWRDVRKAHLRLLTSGNATRSEEW